VPSQDWQRLLQSKEPQHHRDIKANTARSIAANVPLDPLAQRTNTRIRRRIARRIKERTKAINTSDPR
jgi:hypothetical protein